MLSWGVPSTGNPWPVCCSVRLVPAALEQVLHWDTPADTEYQWHDGSSRVEEGEASWSRPCQCQKSACVKPAVFDGRSPCYGTVTLCPWGRSVQAHVPAFASWGLRDVPPPPFALFPTCGISEYRMYLYIWHWWICVLLLARCSCGEIHGEHDGIYMLTFVRVIYTTGGCGAVMYLLPTLALHSV